ncbi:putative calcium-transporting ATPase [Rosa chinensis]|uniref:Putative calcium-transporting ATPase n=1 Tax=Rosa chinensis TaxID=74649 RepID=A0A2P6RP62_ROSCH|nr:putative calcium-transporting ATPase [Rosa chinensis]
MESYLQENFGEVKAKGSSEETLQKWRKLCGVVKNPKRRFRFTANLSKRIEAAAMRRTNQACLNLPNIVHLGKSAVSSNSIISQTEGKYLSIVSKLSLVSKILFSLVVDMVLDLQME